MLKRGYVEGGDHAVKGLINAMRFEEAVSLVEARDGIL
jgi:hypothetical protein